MSNRVASPPHETNIHIKLTRDVVAAEDPSSRRGGYGALGLYVAVVSAGWRLGARTGIRIAMVIRFPS
jgi:hypothetical protein